MNYELIAIGASVIILAIVNSRNTAFVLAEMAQLREETNQVFQHLQNTAQQRFDQTATELKQIRSELNRRFDSTDATIASGFKSVAETTEIRERIARLEEHLRKN